MSGRASILVSIRQISKAFALPRNLAAPSINSMSLGVCNSILLNTLSVKMCNPVNFRNRKAKTRITLTRNLLQRANQRRPFKQNRHCWQRGPDETQAGPRFFFLKANCDATTMLRALDGCRWTRRRFTCSAFEHKLFWRASWLSPLFPSNHWSKVVLRQLRCSWCKVVLVVALQPHKRNFLLNSSGKGAVHCWWRCVGLKEGANWGMPTDAPPPATTHFPGKLYWP